MRRLVAAALLVGLGPFAACSSDDPVIACGEECCADVADQDICVTRVDNCSRTNDEKAEANCLAGVPFNPGCMITDCGPLAR